MPRKRTATSRLDSLEKRRKKVEKKIVAAPQKRTVHEEMEGEREWKMQMAVIYKVAGYSHTEISDVLGVTRGTVSKWFEDKEIQAYYKYVLEHLQEGALTLMRTYLVAAIKRVYQLMMQDDDRRIALDAAKEIFDRGGLPKMSRIEKHEEIDGEVKHKHHFSGRVEIENIEQLTPDQQKQLADVYEQADAILAEAAANGEEIEETDGR